MNLRFNRDKYNLSVGVNYQNTSLKGDLISKNQKIDKTFESVLPVARFNYDFSKVKHLRVDYEASMQEPGIQQLQPVVDNSDPLNISTGNPDLRPSYQHRLTSNFTTFDPDKFINFFAFITANYTLNPIINSQTVNANLVRVTKPINVKDNVSLNGNFNFSLPVKKWYSRFNVGPTLGYTRAINSLNDQLSFTFQQTVGGTARYNFTFKDFITVGPQRESQSSADFYEFNTQNNQEYFNKTYSAEATIVFSEEVSILQ
ncbi:MAG: outer membrane beta-barrel protein [Bacteroidota bacterium]